jgi:hypothetical protein
MTEQGQEKSIPAIQCRTVQGTAVSIAGAALPLINVELMKMPPSALTRWLAFIIAIAGGVVVIYSRLQPDHPPVRGLVKGEGNE